MKHQSLKIALVHEFLTQLGGAEQVLAELTKIFPQAPIYTLIYDRTKMGGFLSSSTIKTSYLQNIPGAVRWYKKLIFLYPRAVELFDLRDFDIVLSESSAFAKGVKTTQRQLHICYCHTPTRYLWIEPEDYLKNNVPAYLRRGVKWLLPRLKRWDYQAAQGVDFFIANSYEVQRRISKYYHRSSQVIYPPFKNDFFRLEKSKADYYLLAGRLVHYKRYDIVIRAFNQLQQKKLIVAGEGPARRELEALTKSRHIHFLGRVSDERLRNLYQRARAYLFPAREDFGITPLEAMACGTPVIAFGAGGARETIQSGIAGIFFPRQSAEAVITAIHQFERKRFSPEKIRQSVLKFKPDRFRMEIKAFVRQKAKEKQLI